MQRHSFSSQAAAGVQLFALALLPASIAMAQTTTQGLTLEEVVVTARKKEESLQDTPIAVSALGSAELELRNVSTIADISQFAPNIQFDNAASESGGGGTSQIAIRGVGQTDHVITVEPGVGLYMDDVYLGKTVGSLIDNIDIEMVEVLRGPQGTLFGKNTIGGAISVKSKRPTEEFEGYLDVTVGDDSRNDYKASVSGSLTDGIRSRLTLSSQNRDGYVSRPLLGEDGGDKDATFARLVTEFDFSENVMATVALDAGDSNENGAPNILLFADENGFFPILHNALDVPACVSPAAAVFGLPGTPDPARLTNPLCFNSQWNGELDDLSNYGVDETSSETDVRGASIKLEWQLSDDLSFKSITSSRSVEADVISSISPNPVLDNQIGLHTDLDTLSQEFQLSGSAADGRLDYIVGLFWMNEEGSERFDVNFFDGLDIVSGGSIDNTSKAIFAQGTYDLSDRLSVTLGVRYSEDELRFRPEQSIGERLGASGAFIGAIFGPTVDQGRDILPRVFVDSKDENFLPLLTFSYDFTDGVMGYASYSQGYKSGGFTMRAFPAVIPGVTTPLTDPSDIIPAFGPEEVEQIELGIKSELFDRRLRLNAAVFRSDYTDLQLLATTGVGGLVPVIFNAGDAEIQGLELEFEFLATEWLRLNGSLGLLDQEYTFVDPNTAGITEDSDLANAPELTANIGATIDLMNNDSGLLFARVDWSYTDEQYKDPVNTPLLKQDAYDLLNVALNWESTDGNWLATLGVNNATDEIYIVSGTANSGNGIVSAVPSRPREWFARVKYSF